MKFDSQLAELVADLEEDAVLNIVQQRIDAGGDFLAIIDECNEGMRAAGSRYEKGEYFIAGLIMAGEIFRQVVEMVQPLLVDQLSGESSGKIVVGTVAGDIHDLGKNMYGMLLTCHGFSIPILVGGGFIDEQIHEYVDSDYWVSDAMAGVRLVEALLSKDS